MGAGYKDLVVWQKAMQLTKEVYKITEQFPSEEKFGLVSQMRRSAVSIPSNIAEGSRRGNKEFNHFLRVALGSASELETQIELAVELYMCDPQTFRDVEKYLNEVLKMLTKMVKF